MVSFPSLFSTSHALRAALYFGFVLDIEDSAPVYYLLEIRILSCILSMQDMGILVYLGRCSRLKWRRE